MLFFRFHNVLKLSYSHLNCKNFPRVISRKPFTKEEMERREEKKALVPEAVWQWPPCLFKIVMGDQWRRHRGATGPHSKQWGGPDSSLAPTYPCKKLGEICEKHIVNDVYSRFALAIGKKIFGASRRQ